MVIYEDLESISSEPDHIVEMFKIEMVKLR
jgi:hypothetical protein